VDTILQGDGDLAKRTERSRIQLEANAETLIRPRASESAAYPTRDNEIPPRQFSCENDERVSGRLSQFEECLEASKVYKRVELGEVDTLSLRASTLRTIDTTLSDFSMNNLSIIAVYRLPVTLNDINTFGPGLTFADIMAQSPIVEGRARPFLSSPGSSRRQNRVPPLTRRPKYITCDP